MKQCSCSGARNCQCQPPRFFDLRGRVPRAYGYTSAGIVSENIGLFHYDVQKFTGRSFAIVPDGQWFRGILFRGEQPTLVMPAYPVMHDPTNPRTWAAPTVPLRRRIFQRAA